MQVQRRRRSWRAADQARVPAEVPEVQQVPVPAFRRRSRRKGSWKFYFIFQNLVRFISAHSLFACFPQAAMLGIQFMQMPAFTAQTEKPIAV